MGSVREIEITLRFLSSSSNLFSAKKNKFSCKTNMFLKVKVILPRLLDLIPVEDFYTSITFHVLIFAFQIHESFVITQGENIYNAECYITDGSIFDFWNYWGILFFVLHVYNIHFTCVSNISNAESKSPWKKAHKSSNNLISLLKHFSREFEKWH